MLPDRFVLRLYPNNNNQEPESSYIKFLLCLLYPHYLKALDLLLQLQTVQLRLQTRTVCLLGGETLLEVNRLVI